MLRTPKIWPVTCFAWSVSSASVNGAILPASRRMLIFMRSAASGVLVGMLPTMRVKANGAMQFERTLNFCISTAIDFDSPTMPSLAAE
ncbi:hypothetical protein D3C72_1829010 [compost metagenome]